VQKLLRDAEKATKTKKKNKGKQVGKRGKKRVESSEEESETSTDDDIVDLNALKRDLFDCIIIVVNCGQRGKSSRSFLVDPNLALAHPEFLDNYRYMAFHIPTCLLPHKTPMEFVKCSKRSRVLLHP
jgi:hypothetical protein